MIVSLNGLSAIQSLFFGKEAAKASGYKDTGRYQIQSGLNNLALTISAIIVWSIGWGFEAKASLSIVMMIFFGCSGINHAVSAIKDKNIKLNSFLRPILSFAMIAIILVFLIKAI